MKKFLLSSFLTLSVFVSVDAQSFKIFYKNTTTEITGTTVYIDSVLNGDIFQKLTCNNISVKNVSGSTLKTRCVRREISIITGSENNFCWGTTCNPPSVSVSTIISSPNIAPGTMDDTFVGDYTPQDNDGSSTILYTFYNNANSSDSASFTIVYTAAIATGVNNLSNSGGSISNAYPNPASSVVSIKYDINEFSQKGKIVFYDMLGKTIKEIVLNEKEGTSKINVSDMKEGIYFYTFVIDDKIVSTKKMVISSK